MLRIILAIAFACACTASAAAADMPKKAGDPRNDYASAGPTFAGFYIGPSIGYAWGETKTEFEGGFNAKPGGFTGGGQVGINYQYGQVVTGIEADVLWLDIKDKVKGAACEGDCGISAKYDLLATVRARIGMTIINPQTLVYATGGIAFGRSALLAEGMKLGTDHFGWTAGGGVEVILSQHWTARVQYLHYNFGDSTVASILPTKDTVNVVTGGLNFRF